jgi:hypothetical protein
VQFEIRDGVIRDLAARGHAVVPPRHPRRRPDPEIDTKPVPKTVNNDDVFRMLRGPRGTVRVAIARRTSPTCCFNIERAKIPIERALHIHGAARRRLRRIIRFSATTGDELERAQHAARAGA